MDAGKLKHRLSFQYRLEADDGHGNKQGDWVEAFVYWAAILPLRGSETVIASRLSGIQPAIITVRSTPQSRVVTPAWRAVHETTDAIYDIKSIADTEQRGQYLDMAAETGAGDG